jgi:Siphovirus ReqiPepy6 Gp37-like protein
MLKILTTNMKWIANIDHYISLQFEKKWHDVGGFELHINRHTKGVEKLKKGTLVMLSPSKVGIIKHREVQLDKNGKQTENWVFKGPDLKGIMNQRLTIPPAGEAHDSVSGPAETIMKHLVNNNAINPVDRKRKFILLKSTDDQGRGQNLNWNSRYKLLSEELRDISIASNIGWDVYLDLEEGWWVFDAFEGKNLSVKNEEGNSPVFFAPEFGNVSSMRYSDSDLNYKNVGFVAGQGEGAEREVIELGDSSDLDRVETFIDARDIEQGGTGTNGETLQQRGTRSIEVFQNETFFEAELITPVKKILYTYDHKGFISPVLSLGEQLNKKVLTSTFSYEEDWDLGDEVTVFNRDWEVITDKRITEIKEIYESRGENFKLEAVFGQSKPTLISKIKNDLNRLDYELKK